MVTLFDSGRCDLGDGFLCRRFRGAQMGYKLYLPFFIWIKPSDAFRVDRFAIELCDDRGMNLFDVEKDQGEIEGLKKMIKRLDVEMYSLAQAEREFAPTEDRFWGPQCFQKPRIKSQFNEAITSNRNARD